MPFETVVGLLDACLPSLCAPDEPETPWPSTSRVPHQLSQQLSVVELILRRALPRYGPLSAEMAAEDEEHLASTGGLPAIEPRRARVAPTLCATATALVRLGRVLEDAHERALHCLRDLFGLYPAAGDSPFEGGTVADAVTGFTRKPKQGERIADPPFRYEPESARQALAMYARFSPQCES